MMWAVLAAALAAVFLLGGLRVGLRGEYTPETAGAWLRVGPTEFRLFPRQEEKKPDRPKKARQEGTGGGKQPRPPFLSRRGLLELGRRLFPLLLEAAGVPMNAYESFLFETAAAYPAMNAFGCFDASGQWNSRMEDEEGVLEEYQYLVYQNVFDKKNMGEGYR